jgi:pimeloyl-ACP methyl ester carboxylesterase
MPISEYVKSHCEQSSSSGAIDRVATDSTMPRLLSLALFAIVIAAAPLSTQRTTRQTAPRETYVLVHGATGGGWDWWVVDSMMSGGGHRVVRPTLTGLGERVHLASPNIGLATHIDDVANVILWENLKDVVLVGHSYGGMVIAGVADRIPERIRRLVYLDAFLPDSGETAIELAESMGMPSIRSSVRDGFLVPGWVTDPRAIPRDVPHPFRTLTDTIHLTNPAARRLPATYILTVEPGKTTDAFQMFADRATKRGWTVYRMAADHTPERSAPSALVKLLEERAVRR